MADVEVLTALLERSRALGFLGPGAVDDHIANALAFVEQFPVGDTAAVLDLGSGGGVPGLVLIAHRPELRITLLDANERRVAFLRAAVRELGADERASVVEGRAEVLARRPQLRERFDVVVARSFGAPAVTAECAAGFLVAGGRVLISERASAPDRWPDDGLAPLGLISGPLHQDPRATIRELRRTTAGLDDVPRALGVPARRPRF